MATLKQRLCKKNSSGTYDTIHLETSASNVLMSNGTTVEAAVNSKAASNHTHSNYAASTHKHSATDITSGTLAVGRGGTGVTTIAALKTALGVEFTQHNFYGFDLPASDTFKRVTLDAKIQYVQINAITLVKGTGTILGNLVLSAPLYKVGANVNTVHETTAIGLVNDMSSGSRIVQCAVDISCGTDSFTIELNMFKSFKLGTTSLSTTVPCDKFEVRYMGLSA